MQPHLRLLGCGRVHPPEGPDGSPAAGPSLGGEVATKCAALALHRGQGVEFQGNLGGNGWKDGPVAEDWLMRNGEFPKL